MPDDRPDTEVTPEREAEIRQASTLMIEQMDWSLFAPGMLLDLLAALTATREALGRCERERDEANEALAACQAQAAGRIRTLETRLRAAQGALRTHGAHLRDCAIYDPEDPGRCNCGYDAALRAPQARGAGAADDPARCQHGLTGVGHGPACRAMYEGMDRLYRERGGAGVTAEREAEMRRLAEAARQVAASVRMIVPVGADEAVDGQTLVAYWRAVSPDAVLALLALLDATRQALAAAERERDEWEGTARRVEQRANEQWRRAERLATALEAVPHVEQCVDPLTHRRAGRHLYRVDRHADAERTDECRRSGGRCARPRGAEGEETEMDRPASSILDRVDHASTWCRRCQSGDHSGHVEAGGLCAHDNQYNADCRCDRRGALAAPPAEAGPAGETP